MSRNSSIIISYWILALILILILIPGATNGEDWPMFLKTPSHISVTSGSIPDKVEILWEAELIGDSYSSPVVVDGKVYVGSGYLAEDDEQENYDVLYCFDAVSGDLLWTFECAFGSQSDFGLCSTPCVYDDKVYFGSSDFHAFCLDAETGDELWSIYLIEETHPEANYGTCASPVVYNEKVYFGTDSYEADGDTNQQAPNLYCLDADGNGDGTTDIIWSYASPQDGFIYSSPAISGNRLVVATWMGTGGEVVCVDTDGNGDGTTTEYWTLPMPSQTQASPTILGDLVFIGDGAFTDYPSTERITYHVYAIDLYSQGELNMYSGEWHYIGVDVFESSAIPYNDKLYVGDLSGTVHCIDTNVGFTKTASADWTFETGNEIWGSATIADGRLIIGNFDGDLYCLETDSGTEVWRIHISDSEIYSSAAFSDGKIYISTLDDNLICLAEKSSHTTNSAPSLTESSVTPEDGDDSDIFSFSVLYTDEDDDPPDYVRVSIDDDLYDMSKVTVGDDTDYDSDYTNGERYIYQTQLDADRHLYYFEASDGLGITSTDTRRITVGDSSDGSSNVDDNDNSGSSNNPSGEVLDFDTCIIIFGIIILIIIAIAIFVYLRRRSY